MLETALSIAGLTAPVPIACCWVALDDRLNAAADALMKRARGAAVKRSRPLSLTINVCVPALAPALSRQLCFAYLAYYVIL